MGKTPRPKKKQRRELEKIEAQARKNLEKDFKRQK